VELEAHNLSSLPAKIVVDFYFVGQPEHQAEPRKLFSRRTFDVDVPPGYQKRVSLRSNVLKSNETRYVTLGEQYNSGYQITGWFLQASVPNPATPFASVSSNPAVKVFGHDFGWRCLCYRLATPRPLLCSGSCLSALAPLARFTLARAGGYYDWAPRLRLGFAGQRSGERFVRVRSRTLSKQLFRLAPAGTRR